MACFRLNLRSARKVIAVSNHYTAVIHDTYDPQRKTYWLAEGVTDSRDAVVFRVSHRCVLAAPAALTLNAHPSPEETAR